MTNSTESIAKKGEKYTAAQIIEALQSTKGMVSLAAKRLGCAPDTVYRYIREYSTVAAAQKQEREAVTDIAELALYKAIQQGEGWAICFYLKTQGRERGYVERMDGRVLNINITPEQLQAMSDDDLAELERQLTRAR